MSFLDGVLTASRSNALAKVGGLFFRDDARQAPKTQGKTPGQPCGNGWISAGYKCGPEKSKAAGDRLRNPENSTARARFTERMRKAKGLNSGPRDKQMSDRLSKKIEAKAAIAPTQKADVPKERHRLMAKVVPTENLSARMSVFENMAKSPNLAEEAIANAKQIVQAFKEEIASRNVKPLKLAQGALTTQSAIASKNPRKAQRGAELLREGVGLPKTPQRKKAGETIKRNGATIFKSNGRAYSIDSSDVRDRADTGMGVRFAGRNTGILVDADSRSEAISKARKKKKRGGDEVEEVWTLTDAQKAQSDKGNWVRTVGKDERHLASEGRRGQGPKPKTYRADTKSGKPGKRCGGGWTSSDNECADDKPGFMESAFKKEAAKRKKSPTSAKTIDTGAKSRIAGLIKKLEQSNATERESLPEHLKLPTENKPVIKGGSPQSRMKRLLSSLENLDKPTDQDFANELKKRGKK